MIQLSKPDFDKRELEAVKRVLDSGWIVQGNEVLQFEDALAKYCKVEHCVVVTSGHAALHLAYLALGIGNGDVVFVPSFAWPSAANVAEMLGARAVFIDVLPDTYNMNPADLEKKIQACIQEKWGKPRLIVPVHEFGLMAEMDAIISIGKKYSVEILEDAACALGATYKGKMIGSFGKLAILSFHPRKAITTGEGGAVITNDPLLAQKIRIWRNHGISLENGEKEFVLPGLNYRMTEFQAAIGRVQMGKFIKILGIRKKLADIYFEGLKDISDIILPAQDNEHTWQTFMIVLKHFNRNEIIKKLKNNNIEVSQGAVAGHMGKYYQDKYDYRNQDLKISWQLAEKGLALPLHSAMDNKDAEKVIEAISKILH